jgi:hypothetical protein
MNQILQAIEQLVESHSQNFDKGEKQNKQLKLLQVYLKGVYDGKTKISTSNKHYVQYSSKEFDNVLVAAGFQRIDDEFVFTGEPFIVDAQCLMERIEEFRCLSFAEVVEIVSAGKTPPGIKTVLENPVGAGDVVSSTSRPQKPWLAS